MCNFGAQGLHNLILLPSVHVSLSCEVELRTKRAITIVIPVGHVSMHLQHRSSLFGSEHVCVFTQTAFASRSDVHRSRLQVSGKERAQRVGAPMEWGRQRRKRGGQKGGVLQMSLSFSFSFRNVHSFLFSGGFLVELWSRFKAPGSPNAHFSWSTALNRDHNSTRRPPEREERMKIAAGEGKKSENLGGPAEGGLGESGLGEGGGVSSD